MRLTQRTAARSNLGFAFAPVEDAERERVRQREPANLACGLRRAQGLRLTARVNRPDAVPWLVIVPMPLGDGRSNLTTAERRDLRLLVARQASEPLARAGTEAATRRRGSMSEGAILTGPVASVERLREWIGRECFIECLVPRTDKLAGPVDVQPHLTADRRDDEV